MYLKKFNKETNSWEIILSNAKDITVKPVLEGDIPITDDDVIVTNYNYEEGSGTTTLNETLTTISDDISKLQRNVSWLSEHGGGGGGGGGGTGSGYAFVLMSPNITNGVYYSEESSLTVTFMITGGTSADIYNYRYTFDGERSPYLSTGNNELVSINIGDLNRINTGTTHSFVLEGTNPLGLNMVPISFKIFETSLKLALNTNPALNRFNNGELILSKDSPQGNVYLDIKNGVLNAQTSIVARFQTRESSVNFINNKTSEQTVSIDLFSELFDRSTIVTNDVFAIELYAKSVLTGIVDLTTSIITLSVRFSSANEMLIYFDGLTYDDDVQSGRVEPSKFENNGRLRFSFNVNLPKEITRTTIYYAARMQNPNTGEWIMFAGTSIEDSAYSTNVQGVAKQNIVLQTSLNGYESSDGWLVEVKAWTWDGTRSAMTVGNFDITASNYDFFPRQCNKRNVYDTSTGNTCLFVWDSSSRVVSPTEWLSRTVYIPINSTTEEVCTAIINLFNSNSAGNGFIPAEIPYLRLQNEAYAVADLSEYQYELSLLTKEMTKLEGFTLSVTIQSDVDANKEKVPFFYGKNDINGNLVNGFKIKGEKAIWQINGNNGRSHTLTAFLRQGIKNTVDFCYKNGTASILVNGIINTAYDIQSLNEDAGYEFSDTIYLGAEIINGEITNFSDICVYEVALYTSCLNPLQLAVNSKNARLDGNITLEERREDYNTWKKNNLIYTEEENPEKPLSYLINEDGEYAFDVNSLNTMEEYSPIPIININANGSGFSKEVFHKDYSNDKSITSVTFNCQVNYYDPLVRKSVSYDALISIQGTSTIGYWVKNLEVKVNVPTSEDQYKVKLFQPKKEWFPEKEFTLKADMVDSSHANNATIGKWINESGIMPEDNPAMRKFTDNTRPKDRVETGGVNYTHPDERTGENIDYDENVKIKHNLEGFPVILLMRFDGEQKTELVGIYSFNLGRYSYYNMGLRFLKAFSRRDRTEPSVNVVCPALIDHYEEYGLNESFGEGSDAIPLNGIFSYEFGANADDNSNEHPTWSQADISVLKHYGDFNFNGSSEDPSQKVGEQAPIWAKLSGLFTETANMELALYPGKDKYIVVDGVYVPAGGNPYGQGDTPMSTFENHMSIGNAVAYFMTATAFGMIDSLGKNLTIRTWDGGNKWWTSFYDMDSALGLYNEGDEGVPETAFIDKFENVTSETAPDVFTVTPHADTTFNAYNSKLWEIFRDSRFLYINNNNKTYYNAKWTLMRQTAKQLASSDSFANLMEEQIGKCGELMYNYDYNSKYLSNKQNISMLHGLRIEYVRSWLRNRTYYLDGVFEDLDAVASMFVDSPFYRDNVNISNEGHATQAIGYIEYTIRSTTTMMMRINTGAEVVTDINEGKYLILANKDNKIKTKEHTSRKQTNFSSSSLITKFDGLEGINVASLSTNVSEGSKQLYSLSNFSISGTKVLMENPLVPQRIFMYDNKSSLESINLSYTNFSAEATDKNFNLDFTGFAKLKNINISYSPVTSLVLPDSSLNTLLIAGSNIRSIYVSKQPVLPSLSFAGCQNLATISLSECDGIESLEIGGDNGLQVLDTLQIQQCDSLKSISIKNNKSLRVIELSNNSALETVEIMGCDNTNLQITIIGSPLKSLKISDIESSNVITLPNKALLSGVTVLTINNCYHFGGVKYDGTEGVEMYRGEKVFDLSPFVSLDPRQRNKVSLTNLVELKYVRVGNDEEKPFYFNSVTFYNCPDLIRIFGNVRIIEAAQIAYMPNFYINEIDDTIVPGEVPPFVTDDPHYTNLSFETNDLSGMFSETNCNISDAYYVLGKCENVRKLNGTFSNCREIRTGSQTSIHAIEQADFNKNAFKQCKYVEDIDNLFGATNIRGHLDADLLVPLVPGEYGTSTTLGITSFENVFNLCDVYLTQTETFFPVGNRIKKIVGFNPICMDENNVEKMYNPQTLLANLSYLEEINNSFCDCAINFEEDNDTRLLSGCTRLETIVNSFRRIAPGTNEHSIATKVFYEMFGATALKNVSYSFSFCTDVNYTNENCVKLYLGNSFFSKVKNSIEYVIGRMSKKYNENKTSTGGIFFTEERDPLSNGNAVIKEINYADCDGENFPYKILKGCSKLVECPGLFYGLSGESAASVTIPDKGMFDDCVKLENFSYGFANMFLKYTLKGEGFKKCNLKNLSYVFADSDGFGKHGMLPYRLFYQENGNFINNLSNAFNGTNDTDMDAYTCPSSVIDNYACELDGESEYRYKWNIYISDGTAEFETRIKDFITRQGWIAINDGEYYVDGDNVKMAPALPAEFKSDYVEIVSQGNITSTNTGYDNNSHLFNIAAKPNYFCPPDILAYCENSTTLNVEGMFSDSGQYVNAATGSYITGIRGKIPPFLFSKITRVSSLNHIFANCGNLYPYRWGWLTDDVSNPVHVGILYPPELFKGMVNLSSINGMFSQTTMWGSAVVPETMFDEIGGTLVSISELWNQTKWLGGMGDRDTQLSDRLFTRCSILSDISSLFNNSRNLVIMSTLFSSTFNKFIVNCSGFMSKCKTASGTIPFFWDGWSMTQVTGCYYDIEEAIPNIHNVTYYTDIPERYRRST